MGRGPVLGLAASAGLALIALADADSRRGGSSLSPLFWIGLLLMFTPIAIRVLAPSTSRTQRLALIVVLGMALYLVKVVAYPVQFTFIDEFIHLRTLQDVLRTHHVFTFNPLLPASAVYPGLEGLTAAIVDVTKLSPFVSGLVVIGLARALFCVAFFLVAERATESSRGAAAASLVYFGNPMFLYWSSYYSYENLALPLGAVAVWWLMRSRGSAGWGAVALGALTIAAVTVTHHIVGFALAALLLAWWVVERVARGSRREVRRVGLSGLAATAASVAWVLTVARPAIGYLWAENIYPGLSETVSVLTGHLPLRTLYSSGGDVAPLWERFAGFGGVAVLLLALPFGVYLARTRHLRRPAMLLVALAAVAYPVSLIPRLAPQGVAISGRSSEYLYTGLGCTVGLLLVAGAAKYFPRALRFGRHRLPNWAVRHDGRATVTAALLATLVFVGGITVGTPYSQLLPQAAASTGYPASVQPAVIAAARWARANLGVNQRFAASALDAPTLGSDGEQYAVPETLAWPIFFGSSLSRRVVSAIRTAHVRYVLADRDLVRYVPSNPSYYFTPYEPNGTFHKHPLSRSDLSKFSANRCVDLVYSSGQVKIYYVGRILTGRCNP